VKRFYYFFIAVIMIILFASCAESDSKAPAVVETFPITGSTDVDPSISEISVTFDEPMTDGNWSWAYTNKNKFPEMTGQPYYIPGHKKNILPVQLESNKEYEIWINSEKFRNFKDIAGNPAIPFRLVFKTR
jgi:hypothetical protein